jgi:hypothetical protein
LEIIILKHFPGAAMANKIGFLRRALSAFCNFYGYTVGELSAAIVTPVQSLLQVLHNKVVHQQQKTSPGQTSTASMTTVECYSVAKEKTSCRENDISKPATCTS